MQLRTVRPSRDLENLDALFQTVEECDGHAPIGEHKYLDLLHAHGEGNGLVATDDADQPIAYIALSPTQEHGTWAMEMAVHPLHRSRSTVRKLIDAGVDEVERARGRRVRIWAFQPNFAGFLEEAGFVPERELRQLRRSLPVDESPSFPEGISVRSFRPGEDERVWLDVNNRAFADHPENGSWTVEVLQDRERQEWFDPEGFRMAWEGDELAGFCWTKIHDAQTGEIYVIAVDPGHQGKGLGRALVLEGLDYMYRVGGTTAMLYVDSDNAPGLKLYASLGFRLDHVDRALVKEI